MPRERKGKRGGWEKGERIAPFPSRFLPRLPFVPFCLLRRLVSFKVPISELQKPAELNFPVGIARYITLFG